MDVNLTTSVISSSLDADHLVLSYQESEFSWTKSLRVRDISILKEMLSDITEPKIISLLEASVNAIQSSTDSVHFINATNPDSILLSMFINKES